MPRVCFEEKPQINTFYDDVEVCKRGGKKRKQKAKATISNVNKVIVNLTQGNRRRMTAPTRTFANPPKALQSITYSNPVAPSHFDNRPISTHNEPMKIFKDTVEEKIRNSIPTFGALENPTGLRPVDTNARRVIPSRIPSGGVLSSAPVVQTQQAWDTVQDVMQRMKNPSYFPPTGSASNLPKPQPAQEEIARPSNFVPLVGAQPESREEQQERLQTSYKIRTPIEGDVSSRYKEIYRQRKLPEGGTEPFMTKEGRQSILRQPIPKDRIPESKEEKEPSKKRGGSVF